MRKVYRFHQLPKKARKNAAEHVCEREQSKPQDWSIENDYITESLDETLRETKLDVSGGFSWEDYYGISIDLSKIGITDDFIQKVLSKEDYELYQDLEEISSGYLKHHLFEKYYEKEGYALTFDYPSAGFEEEEAMKFIVKYCDEEEIVAKYQFPLLMETELSREEYAELESDVKELAEHLTESIEGEIAAKIEDLVDNLKQTIRDSLDYQGSKQYYYDQLEAENYPEEYYLFNYQGEVILYKGEFIKEEYEEKYHDAA